MQALTPEQSKMAWNVTSEIARWIVSALIVWGLNSMRTSIKAIRPGIVADVTANVTANFEQRMSAHEKLDDRRFLAREKFEYQTSNALSRIEGQLRVRHQHGD